MDTIATTHTDQFTPLVIFSSGHGFPFFAKAHGISYKPVMGLYRGVIEESFVVNHTDAPFIMTEGLLKGQETVLLLSPQAAVFNGQREVWLSQLFEDGMTLRPHPKFFGLWHKVSCDEALHCKAWTCYPAENAWYVAKMPETDL